jgi:hypothetical protein
MFGREDKSLAKHEQMRGITSKICYLVVTLIAINFLTEIINKGIY